MDKKNFDRFEDQCFIKSSDSPRLDIAGDEKARLNRKGNELFNKGELETARRVFQTTGYSDGLIRVGDKYLESGKPVEALKMYWLAKDSAKAEDMAARAARAIQKLLHEDEDHHG